jgi:FkbM family methyltransferase
MKALIAQTTQRARDHVAALVPGVARREVGMRRQAALKHQWDLHALTMLTRRSGIAIDAGANIGIYTSVLAERFDAVWSFEPNPTLVPRLQALRISNTAVFPLALGNETMRSTLAVPVVDGRTISGLGHLGSSAAPANQFDIVVVPLDSLSPPHISLVKVDVEGFEESMLNGSKSVLQRDHPDVLIEIEERHNPGGVARIVNMLAAIGYEGWFGFAGKLVPAETFESQAHQELVNGKAAHSARYGHMFVFSAEPKSELVRAASRALSEQPA